MPKLLNPVKPSLPHHYRDNFHKKRCIEGEFLFLAEKFFLVKWNRKNDKGDFTAELSPARGNSLFPYKLVVDGNWPLGIYGAAQTAVGRRREETGMNKCWSESVVWLSRQHEGIKFTFFSRSKKICVSI